MIIAKCKKFGNDNKLKILIPGGFPMDKSKSEKYIKLSITALVCCNNFL